MEGLFHLRAGDIGLAGLEPGASRGDEIVGGGPGREAGVDAREVGGGGLRDICPIGGDARGLVQNPEGQEQRLARDLVHPRHLGEGAVRLPEHVHAEGLGRVAGGLLLGVVGGVHLVVVRFSPTGPTPQQQSRLESEPPLE